MRIDNIEASKTHPLAPVGLLAEVSVAHRAGLIVRLLLTGEALSAGFVVAVTLEVPPAAGALEALPEGTMEEATGKLRG